METFRNTSNSNFATIVNKGEYGFTVYFGYTNGSVLDETVTKMKVFKTEKMAIKKAKEYVG